MKIIKEWPLNSLGIQWGIYETDDGRSYISDSWTCEWPITYDDGRVAYDNPESIPKYVKKEYEKIYGIPEPVGVWPICNTAALNIYDIDVNGDYVKAGLSTIDKRDSPRLYKTYMTKSSQELYFMWGRRRVYLSEVMRCR